jgi:hypothetical protein
MAKIYEAEITGNLSAGNETEASDNCCVYEATLVTRIHILYTLLTKILLSSHTAYQGPVNVLRKQILFVVGPTCRVILSGTWSHH